MIIFLDKIVLHVCVCVCVFTKHIFVHRMRFGKTRPQAATCSCLWEVEEERKMNFSFLLTYINIFFSF